MQADSKVVAILNSILTQELTSINRYFLHARMFKNWGFEGLDKVCYKQSIEDMKQSDALIERILFLHGLPNLQKLDALQIGEHPEEMLQCDLNFQLQYIPTLKDAIAQCESAQDYVSRQLLESILEHEEDHLDWLESQHFQISQMTLENYLQAQLSDD